MYIECFQGCLLIGNDAWHAPGTSDPVQERSPQRADTNGKWEIHCPLLCTMQEQYRPGSSGPAVQIKRAPLKEEGLIRFSRPRPLLPSPCLSLSGCLAGLPVHCGPKVRPVQALAISEQISLRRRGLSLSIRHSRPVGKKAGKGEKKV